MCIYSFVKLNVHLLKIVYHFPARRETQRILPHRNDIIRGFFPGNVSNLLMKGIRTAWGWGEILGVLEMETYPFHLFFTSLKEE